MRLVLPEILSDGQGFSIIACSLGLAVGFIVWVLGGWSHRFWLLLVTTLAAGVYGLSIGEAFGVQPLVSALLVGLAGGALALALIHVTAFVAGGMTVCLLAERFVVGWNEPFVFFFIGGFLGLFLLRLWLMVLTSFAGSLIMTYSTLWLLDTLGKVDAPTWAQQKPILLNWICAGGTVLGLLVQIAIDRRRRRHTRLELFEPKESRGWRLLGWFGSSDGGKKNRAA